MNCPQCNSEMSITDKEQKYNLSRLTEQKEIRKPGEVFNFNYLGKCENHGLLFVQKKLKLKETK